MDSTHDCIVVGAGAAGLSAALVLGRARRDTLVVDAGAPSNRFAHGVGGLLGHDTRPPAELYARGREELAAYPFAAVRDGEVVAGERDGDGFALTLADGSRARAPRVLLATGMEYRYPSLPGMDERWGRSVFHCPFCHGWEVRERPLAVLDASAHGAMRAMLLRAWSDEVTLLTNGPSALGDDDHERLAAAGIALDERPVAGVDGPGEDLEAVAFADGGELRCGGLLVGVTMHQRSALLAQLGAALAEPNPLHADAPEVDAMGATSVPGLWAAGDLVPVAPSVPVAMASGARAAAAVVQHVTARLDRPPARLG